MVTATIERVEKNTTAAVNERIRLQTQASIARYAKASAPAIRRRLRELDREWDIERFLETMAPSITLFGLVMGVAKNRKWLLLPVMVQSFFLQHALQGWCPPIPILRRLGIRTVNEIQMERDALRRLKRSR
jgi:DNA-binding Lrp family transcriptional regulator